MRLSRARRALTLVPLALAHGACAESEHAPSAPEAGLPLLDAGVAPSYSFPCLGAPAATGAPTFTAIYAEVMCNGGCVDAYCHGSRGTWADLDLSQLDGAYYALVNQPTGKLVPVDMRPTCAESALLRVKPGAPDESLLYLKVSGRAPCGTRMPPPSSEYRALGDAQVAQIRRWIERGAPSFRDEP